MDKRQALTESLSDRFDWERPPTRGFFDYLNYGDRPWYARRPTPEELAEELLQDAEFRSLQLGTVLGTPEVHLVAHAVEAASPPFYRSDEQLLVEALTLAAKMQNRQAAGRLALGAVTLHGPHGDVGRPLANRLPPKETETKTETIGLASFRSRSI
jgi:hypothetical protein